MGVRRILGEVGRNVKSVDGMWRPARAAEIFFCPFALHPILQAHKVVQYKIF